LLDAGYIYIGVKGADPQVSPLTVYWDEAKTQVAAQPLRTRGGFIVNGATPAFVWVDAADYSQRVKDADGNLVSYTASALEAGATPQAYQPLDADLTAIAALVTTTFGRSLLELANAAALRSAAGIVDSIPAAGGTVGGNIIRSGAGPHLYHNNSAMTSGRVFVTAIGAADPTSLPGDIWIRHP
ncbi:MAG TPA: hypothetical protein VGW38_19455, partial [Chloroflexota bacterium]|nr:hypothetical protein [Chloroflexota bacterium]